MREKKEKRNKMEMEEIFIALGFQNTAETISIENHLKFG